MKLSIEKEKGNYDGSTSPNGGSAPTTIVIIGVRSTSGLKNDRLRFSVLKRDITMNLLSLLRFVSLLRFGRERLFLSFKLQIIIFRYC